MVHFLENVMATTGPKSCHCGHKWNNSSQATSSRALHITSIAEWSTNVASCTQTDSETILTNMCEAFSLFLVINMKILLQLIYLLE
jgi:hypothetical protein